jgi:hypothetical protein
MKLGAIEAIHAAQSGAAAPAFDLHCEPAQHADRAGAWRFRLRADAIEGRSVTNRAGEPIAGLVAPKQFRAPRTPPVADPPHYHHPILTPK